MFHLRQAATGRLGFGLPRKSGSAQRSELLAMCLPSTAQGGQLSQCVGELAFGFPEGRAKVQIRRWHRGGDRSSAEGHLRLRGGPFVEESTAIALQRIEIRRQPGIAQLRRRGRGPCDVMCLTPIALQRRPDGELDREPGCSRLSLAQISHRPLHLDPHAVALRLGDGQPGGGLVPAGVHGQDQRVGQFGRGGLA